MRRLTDRARARPPARRSRRPTAASRSRWRRSSRGRARRGGASSRAATLHRDRALLAPMLRAGVEPSVDRAARARSAGAQVERSARRTPTRSRRRSRSSTRADRAARRRPRGSAASRASRAWSGACRRATRRRDPPRRTTSPSGRTRSRARGSATRSWTRVAGRAGSPEQGEDGGWQPKWAIWTPATKVEWGGIVTLRALKILAAYGRL